MDSKAQLTVDIIAKVVEGRLIIANCGWTIKIYILKALD